MKSGKTKFYAASALFILILTTCSVKQPETVAKKGFNPPVSFERASEWADSVVALMSIDEKMRYIGGTDFFYSQDIPRLNISRVFMADATQGVHLRDSFRTSKYVRALEKSTSFPSPILLASTWNKNLAGEYARSIGEECRAGGIAVLLGPGMNIYRQSQCGRNFEYFGEDPFLAGSMIENYVTGLQNTGVIATLKHFACNNTDFYRRKSNSIVDERTLNEIYLPAFKAGIDAGAMAVMTSYNQVNGEWTGQSSYVINDILRKQLGFKWLVMTDWWSVYDGEKVIKSGQDLEMPSSFATANADSLLKANIIREENIDRMVTSALRTFYAMQAYNRTREDKYSGLFNEHEQTALATAREGIVLLKNNGILPLENTEGKKILVTGEFVEKIAAGGGAAAVEGFNQLKLIDALQLEFGEKINYIENPSVEEIKKADIVLFSAGTNDSEGWDRPFDLPAGQENRIKQCINNNANTIVLINSGSGVNMTGISEKAAAIVYAWYGGQTGNTAVVEILSGKINPSGKLPVTIERRFEDSPGFGYIPEGESLYNDWNGDEEKAHPVYDVLYKEGIFVGYRWYEKQAIEPLFPFGYGLSYTTFEYSGLQLSPEIVNQNDELSVIFSIKNTGKREGKEVAQLYVTDVESSIPRPVKELKGFDKINLQPGEQKQISIKLSKKDFSFWHPEKKDWVAEPGKFKILIGSSSAGILLEGEIELKE